MAHLTVRAPWAESLAYVTPSFLRGTERCTPYLMGTPGRPASSAHLAIDMARVRLAVRPSILVLSRDHRVTCLLVCHTLATLAGTGRRVSPPTRWTGLYGAPTIAPCCPWQQPVRTCRSPRLGMAARLRFQGLPLPAPHHVRFQGPSAQFIDLAVVGLLSTSCHRTSQFTVMLDVPV